MEQERFPFGDRVQLTPELVDLYVALAREERTKAITGFGRHIASWMGTTIARLARRHRNAGPRHMIGSPTV
jgi:hypothetical protein